MRKRVIPVLLLDRDKRLVKTVRFGQRTYVGDPFNVVRLFNEKEVDEICILDIDATADRRAPDIGFIKELATECFMPLAYGGGITTVDQCEQLSRYGVEKFVLGHGATSPEIIKSLRDSLGSQAIVACVDVIREGSEYACVTRNARTRIPFGVFNYCHRLEEQGVGEIILQSVDRDGERIGYDLELIKSVSSAVSIPVVALGGAGELAHIGAGLKAGASAAASGSTFTFIGRLRAVLITYPGADEIDRLSRAAQ